MQFLVFADLHISEKIGLSGGNSKIDDNGTPRRRSLVEQEACLDWIVDCAAGMGPDAILFLGDLYDRANPTPNEEAVALEGMQRLADLAPTYCLLGNHTQSLGDDESALASLRSIRHDDLHVVESPRIINFDGVRLYCLPYPPLGRIVDQGGEGWSSEVRNGKVSKGLAAVTRHFANDAVDYDGTSVLASHVTFAGSEYQEGRAVPMTDVRVPTDRLPDFNAVAAGHLHMRQQIGGLQDAWYVGPPDRWSFNDQGNPAGIGRLLTDEGSVKWQFRPYPNVREFDTISPDLLLQWGESGFEGSDHDFIRVRGTVDDLETVDRLETIRDQIGPTFGTLKLDVTVESDDREITQVDPDGGLRELFDTYCDDRPDAVPDDLEDEVFGTVESVVEQMEVS